MLQPDVNQRLHIDQICSHFWLQHKTQGLCSAATNDGECSWRSEPSCIPKPSSDKKIYYQTGASERDTIQGTEWDRLGWAYCASGQTSGDPGHQQPGGGQGIEEDSPPQAISRAHMERASCVGPRKSRQVPLVCGPGRADSSFFFPLNLIAHMTKETINHCISEFMYFILPHR